jgi:hypothetical protein
MKYEYYYNDVPNIGKCRNNLIYTSLISEDKKTFVQWYYNDTDYHKGHNEVIDPGKMDEKWEREVKFLKLMHSTAPTHIPNILDIDYNERKIYLEIDGVDFWQQANCDLNNYDTVLPNWRKQMTDIINVHKVLGIHKYSMHPSSYFIVNNKLKSINYFFTYGKYETNITIREVESHIHENRRVEMRKYLESLGISWTEPQPWELFDKLCWESFRTNYPQDFIEKILND